MDWKKLLINAGLAAGWVTAAYLLDDPRFIALAPVLRFIAGWLASKLGATVPVDK